MFSEIVFILKCLDWNNGSQLAAVCRQRWSSTVANTLTHDGYGSVNITARRRVCDSCRSPLSAVQYDPLLYSRHNGGDGTAKVGREINKLSSLPRSVFWATVCKTVRPMLSDRCPVCNVGVMWPNSWMDQDESWHAGRPLPCRPHCARWRSAPP